MLGGDVDTEIFSLPTLGSPACLVWHRVLLPVVGSSSRHTLDPGQYYLLQALDVDLWLCGKLNWGIISRSIVTPLNTQGSHKTKKPNLPSLSFFFSFFKSFLYCVDVLVSLFYGLSTHSWEYKKVHAFLKSISLSSNSLSTISQSSITATTLLRFPIFCILVYLFICYYLCLMIVVKISYLLIFCSTYWSLRFYEVW